MNGGGYEKSGYITNGQDVCSHSVANKIGVRNGWRLLMMIRTQNNYMTHVQL
jgi:hypothetical protein